MNFISIKPAKKGDGDGVVFRVADDRHVSRLLWIFMIENIRPGFIVTLQTAGGELSQASGGKVGIDEYRRHMAAADFEEVAAHMALHEKQHKGR